MGFAKVQRADSKPEAWIFGDGRQCPFALQNYLFQQKQSQKLGDQYRGSFPIPACTCAHDASLGIDLQA